MYWQKMMTWGLAASVAVGLLSPVAAHGDMLHIGIGGIGLTIKDHVVVRHPVPPDETPVFQQWYDYQMRDYDRVDPDSGERVADMLRMVTDVHDNIVVVTDRHYVHQEVRITRRTDIILPDGQEQSAPDGRPLQDGNLAAPFQPGQFVVCDGHLREGGGLVANQVHIYGHAHGWLADDAVAHAVPFDGVRIWGTLGDLDIFGNVFTLNNDSGRHPFHFDHGAVVMADGHEQPLDAMHRGDRLVVYYHYDAQGHPLVYRVVILREHDNAPEGNAPYWTDPAARADEPVLEGHLRFIDSGRIFDTLTVRVAGDREMTVRCPQTLQVIDRDGHRQSCYDLHDGEPVRIKYFEAGGLLFAKRIELP